MKSKLNIMARGILLVAAGSAMLQTTSCAIDDELLTDIANASAESLLNAIVEMT